MATKSAMAALAVALTSASAFAADPPAAEPAPSAPAAPSPPAPTSAQPPVALFPASESPSPASPPPASSSSASPPLASSPEPPASPPFAPIEYDDSDELAAPDSGAVPTLAKPVGPGAALEGYGGLALLVGPGPTRSRAVVGGLLRLRYHYFQLGAAIEVSDGGESDAFRGEEHWRTLQGFAGAVLPFDHFVDLDASIGYGQRTFLSSDRDYGPDGLRTVMSALVLRFGISDRTSNKRFGGRVGAALIGTFDVSGESVPYERSSVLASGAVTTTRGGTDFGGASLSLVLTAALELGARPGIRF